MIILNAIVINKNYKTIGGEKILELIKWVGIFSIIYILLLPFGGFRSYRENIIRYDTIMPVTIALMFIFGITTFYLLKNISGNYKKIYVSGIIIILLIFTNSDRFDPGNYQCEKEALETIAHSSEKIIELESDCPVMEWIKLTDYKKSEGNATLFNYWNISDEKKLYYHKYHD